MFTCFLLRDSVYLFPRGLCELFLLDVTIDLLCVVDCSIIVICGFGCLHIMVLLLLAYVVWASLIAVLVWWFSSLVICLFCVVICGITAMLSGLCLWLWVCVCGAF